MARRTYMPEKGTLDILGHSMNYEMIRSEKPTAFGIQESRIYELNLYRDGTLTADYNRKWLKVPLAEDEASQLAIQELIGKYGKEKPKKDKRSKKDA